MYILSVILLVLGLFSLIYYGTIVSYAGTGSSFSWFWLLLGVGMILLSFAMIYSMKHDIRLPRTLRNIMISFVCLGICIFLLVEGMIISHGNRKADGGMDYLIVLGAQVRGTRVSRTLKKRLDTALSYLKTNPDTVAIVSGGRGSGEDITEAEAMKRYLREQRIEEKRIIKEEKSTSTIENILFSKGLIGGKDARVAVVTNGFHVFRSVCIARKQGLENIQGLSAPSDPVLFFNYYVREVFGVIKDWAYGNL